jgi:hypothetical protein
LNFETWIVGMKDRRNRFRTASNGQLCHWCWTSGCQCSVSLLEKQMAVITLFIDIYRNN